MEIQQRNLTWSWESEDILQNRFPIHVACRDGDVKSTISLITSNNGRGEQSNNQAEDSFYNWTPAHWAAYFGKLSCLRMLISEGGTSVDIKTSQFQQTPCHMSAFSCHPHCLRFLLVSGASVNERDYLGETPLHKAARTGSVECISLILTHFSPLPLIRNNAGQTAADLADLCGYSQCSRYLKQIIQSHTQPSAGLHVDIQPSLSHTSQSDITNASVHRHEGNGDSSTSMAVDTHISVQNNGDVLMLPGVDNNTARIAGLKRSREDEEDECWKKLKLSGLTPANGTNGFHGNIHKSHNEHCNGVVVMETGIQDHLKSLAAETRYNNALIGLYSTGNNYHMI